MKKTLTLLACAVMLPSLAMANTTTGPQTKPAPHPHKVMHIKKMTEELNLSPAQAEQMRTLFKEHRGQDWKSATPEQRKTRMAAFDTKVQKILDKSQYTRFKAMQDARMKARMAVHFDRMAQDLKLNPIQKQQMQNLFADMGKHRGGDYASMTSEQRKAKRAEFNTRIQKILDKSQYEQFKQRQKEMRDAHRVHKTPDAK